MAKARVDMDNSWSMLKDAIHRNTPAQSGSYPTPIAGFMFHRQTSNADPKPHFFEPVVILVAQGTKLVKIGFEEQRYGENICFICGVNMPATSCVIEASNEKPYLSLSLQLNTGLMAGLASKIPPIEKVPGVFRGAMTQKVEPDLLDAFVRLADLAEKPEHIPGLEEPLLREIHYRLLVGPCGNILRSLNTFGSQEHQITRAITWLKEHYAQPLRVEALARQSNMAPSTFHKYFKEITTLSPLQYQKRLRLGEARTLMLSEGYAVTQAAMAVGYESVTQFIREYKRLFGAPPKQNIKDLRETLSDRPGLMALSA